MLDSTRHRHVEGGVLPAFMSSDRWNWRTPVPCGVSGSAFWRRGWPLGCL